MKSFQLEIVTPTKVLDEGHIEHVRCPGLDGYFGVMANHRGAIIAIGIGEIKVTQNGKDHYLATSGGFVEISKAKVELLLETYERAEDIDVVRAESALQRAKKRTQVKDIDAARNEASLLRAVNRLKILKR